MINVQVMGKEGRLRSVRKIAPVQTRRAADKLEHEIRDELLRADDRVATTATRIASFRRFCRTVRVELRGHEQQARRSHLEAKDPAGPPRAGVRRAPARPNWTGRDRAVQGRKAYRQALEKNGPTREVPLCKQALDALPSIPGRARWSSARRVGSMLTHAQQVSGSAKWSRGIEPLTSCMPCDRVQLADSLHRSLFSTKLRFAIRMH